MMKSTDVELSSASASLTGTEAVQQATASASHAGSDAVRQKREKLSGRPFV